MNKDLLELYSDYLLSAFSHVTATGLSAMTGGTVSHNKREFCKPRMDSKSRSTKRRSRAFGLDFMTCCGLAPKLQATIRRGGLFRTKLPLLVSDPDFWCKASCCSKVVVLR